MTTAESKGLKKGSRVSWRGLRCRIGTLTCGVPKRYQLEEKVVLIGATRNEPLLFDRKLTATDT